MDQTPVTKSDGADTIQGMIPGNLRETYRSTSFTASKKGSPELTSEEKAGSMWSSNYKLESWYAVIWRYVQPSILRQN